MSSLTSGNFPFQVSSQDAYSNYENPAFRIRIRDIRDTGVAQVSNFNDTDYSRIFHVGDNVVGKRLKGKSERLYKGVISNIISDEKGRASIIVIRSSDNKSIKLDVDSVVKVQDNGDITDVELLGYHDNFYVPGPSKNMAEPQKIMAESRVIKTFSEFKNGL